MPQPPQRRTTRSAPISTASRALASAGPASRLLVWLGLAIAVLLPAAVAQADWLSKIVGAAEHAGSRTAKLGSGGLDRAAAHVKALPRATGGGAVLAAQATQEGHWRFVNRAGETLTAGTPEEMKRVAALLLPEAKGSVKLSLYVTEDTVFLYRAGLKDLPAGTDVNVVVGSEAYRVLRRTDGGPERLFAEVRPNLVVELAERRAFEEIVWQLARPLEASSVRLLAIEPGGPPTLASLPRLDAATQRALADTIDPASLPAALGSVRGQTVLVTGRIDGRLLYVQPSRGAERSLLLPDLLKAAEEADVNLVVLHASSTPRQPGGRNWLWQKVEVRGLEQALGQARVADFLAALTGPNGRVTVTASASGPWRTLLDVKPATNLPEGPRTRPMGDVFSEMVSDLTGRIVTAGVQASVRSAERQQELDQRLLPAIPSDLQLGYLAFIVLGLIGFPVSLAWWRRIWPPEVRAEYAGEAGYRAARIVRGAAFLFIFLPLSAPIAAPYNIVRQIIDTMMMPVRLWRWLTGRATAASAG
jgi:hypothetical protein